MANLSQIKLPNGTTYDIKDANAIPKNTTGNTQNLRRPASLQGTSDVTIDSKINTLRANRLAFLPADQIIIEKTTDGGTTWVDAGVADSTKVGLFSETRHSVNIPLLNNKKSPLCGLRLTITAMKYDVPSGTAETAKYNYWNKDYVKSTERYNQLKEMYFWVSVSGGSINVKVERATGANPTSWSVIFNDTTYNMTGYSGNDYISFSQGVFGGGTTQVNNYWNYRITFMTDDIIPASPYDGYSQSIMEIRGYGDTWWTKGNEYAANDKIYEHDYLKNVVFPAKVTATEFVGPLSGTASTASLAVKSRSLEGTDTRSTNQLPSWYISNYPFRIIKEFKTTSAIGVNSILSSFTYCDLITDIYYTDSSGGLPIQIAINHKGERAIRFATSTSAWGIWQDLTDASKVNGHTVNSDVPSDAKFTDTVTTATTSGSGNAVTAITASNGALTVTKGSTFLTGITSSQVTTALGYTPYNSTNPSGYTANTGTVTKVTAGTGLSIGTTAGGNFTTSGTINHTNSVTAQTTQAVYPIKIDAQGHISAYGSAVTISTNWLNGSATGSVRTIHSQAEDSNYTIGQYAVAEGAGTKASGVYSHAEGASTIASGGYSHAEGAGTAASGVYSHAEGIGTTASEYASHAEGGQTTASGYHSHAEGYYTIANHNSQHVFGQYNIADSSDASASVRGTYIEIVGNGTDSSARSNARTLDWSGNEVLAGKLTVGAVGTNSMDVATVGQIPTVPSSTGSATTGISIAAHGTGTVIGVQSTTTTASKVTVGSSSTDYGVKSAGSASTWTFEEKTIPNVTSAGTASSWTFEEKTIPNVTAAGSGSASLTFAMDTTDTKKLKITFSHTHTAPTIGTAIKVQSKSGGSNGTAPTLGTAIKVQSKSGGANSTAPTLGSKVPTVSASDVTVPIKNASASTFVTGTTHTVTDNGHTHTI